MNIDLKVFKIPLYLESTRETLIELVQIKSKLTQNELILLGAAFVIEII